MLFLTKETNLILLLSMDLFTFLGIVKAVIDKI